jgi:methylenetetrahydrofolate reductase (NADPH)
MDQHCKLFSFELFPPKSADAMQRLKLVVDQLQALNPLYFSCTYGAGGANRSGTLETVSWLRQCNIETAPHLTCIASNQQDVQSLVDGYREQGITRIVALRGDPPSGTGYSGYGEFRYASDLVQFLRTKYGDQLHIEVAAYPEFHPQANTALQDVAHFKLKVDAGADAAITQYFYNADSYCAFLDLCAQHQIDIPIIPGIMPITNYTQLARFSDACGAEIPRWIRRRLEAFADDQASLRAFGHEVVVNLCQRLLVEEDVPGLHFYTMNQAEPIVKLWQDLDLPECCL